MDTNHIFSATKFWTYPVACCSRYFASTLYTSMKCETKACPNKNARIGQG